MRHISQIRILKQKIGNWRKSSAVKWPVLLVCLLGIIFAGISVNQYQALSADSRTLHEFVPVQHSEGQSAPAVAAMTRSQNKLATTPSIWPVSGGVTSAYGWRNSPWGGGRELHPGIDIANNMDTPVVATADGKVVRSEGSEGYGNIVEIDHGNNISTIYGHNSRILVQAGQDVRKGQVIAYLGSTGKSTGPHVHYEIRVNGTAVDPLSYLVLY